jgi:hypothetical protein
MERIFTLPCRRRKEGDARGRARETKVRTKKEEERANEKRERDERTGKVRIYVCIED